VEYAAERGERRVVARLREQRDPERRGLHRRRHGQRAEVEQVDEVGVGAEPAVEPDRIGEHLRDGVDRRHRRQCQHIDLAEGVVAHAPQLFELVERLERIDRARMRAAENDLPGHGCIASGADAISERTLM
jgi:hypothetical protein